jgi:hypothetical protein
MGSQVMNARVALIIATALLFGGAWGATLTHAAGASATSAGVPPCVPGGPDVPGTLFDRVPVVASAQMMETRDGGVAIAFSSYRGSPEFPESRSTVLALSSSGCLRWRASLPGPLPIARPVQSDESSIVAAAGTFDRDGGVGPLHVETLSASTGRVVRSNAFSSLGSATGLPPTLLGDGRGAVAMVLATFEPSGTAGRFKPVALKLTRRAHARRWRRQVIARANTRPPAAAARADGKMVVGYPRKGRFWVRTGTVAGRVGRPMDAGPVGRNFQGGAVALGRNGTVAAVWQSATYSRPWRLLAAVRPARSKRFARFAQLGFAPSSRGSFFNAGSPVVRVSADGHVTVGFAAPNKATGGRQVTCATATPNGQFGPARRVATAAGPLELPAMIFGPADSAAIVAPTHEGSVLLTSVAGCHARSSRLLARGVGNLLQAVIDGDARAWLLGQAPSQVGLDEAREPLLLTIAAPIG